MPKLESPRKMLATLLLCALTLTPFSLTLAQSNDSSLKASPVVAMSASPSETAALARIEDALELRRKELNIPGMSLAIVKDDRVIYIKGFGVKDFERNVAVTPDTLFAIGSSSKAFTAMSIVMGQDAGRISLDDSPKKFLPYFKLQDADADARIRIRDLLSHRSGLNRTDLAWVSGRLNREEVIKVAGQAKPTAKFGEKFLYQNVMFTAAGEADARSQRRTWDEAIKRNIFAPLGMTRSVTTVAEMQRSNDFSFGYDYAPATKITRRLPTRDLREIAPAGAINSSARDMAQWVRLMLGNGVFDGKRLVSEKGMKELVTPQIEMTPQIAYGLGWFLREWKGKKIVEHGGNIDGFNAQVALMPEKRLGFVLLTNVSSSPIGQMAMETVWSNLAGDAEVAAGTQTAGLTGDLQRKAGKYLFAEASTTIDVALTNGKLTATVPAQPVYTLEDTGGGRYALIANGSALPGFFMSFRPVKTNEAELEMFLEQPQGNYVLARVKPTNEGSNAANNAASDETLRALIGRYEDKDKKATIEVAERAGKISLVVPRQPPYALIPKEGDVFATAGLPDEYSVKVNRDAATNNIVGITLRQPQGNFEFMRATAFVAPLSVDELMAKVVEAMGGEQALRRHTSLRQTFNINLENQGITGTGTTSTRAPNLFRQELRFMTLGKEVATTTEVFDGTRGAEATSFSPVDEASGASLADMRISSDFYQPLNWKTLFKKIEITGVKKIGDEETFVVVKTPAEGNPVTDYISTKSFLILRRDSIESSSTSEIVLPVTETFSDFRLVEGVRLPFKTVMTQPSMGTIIIEVTDARANVSLADTLFRVPTAQAMAASK